MKFTKSAFSVVVPPTRSAAIWLSGVVNKYDQVSLVIVMPFARAITTSVGVARPMAVTYPERTVLGIVATGEGVMRPAGTAAPRRPAAALSPGVKGVHDGS